MTLRLDELPHTTHTQLVPPRRFSTSRTDKDAVLLLQSPIFHASASEISQLTASYFNELVGYRLLIMCSRLEAKNNHFHYPPCIIIHDHAS